MLLIMVISWWLGGGDLFRVKLLSLQFKCRRVAIFFSNRSHSGIIMSAGPKESGARSMRIVFASLTPAKKAVWCIRTSGQIQGGGGGGAHSLDPR